jgi:hypothetical protein
MTSYRILWWIAACALALVGLVGTALTVPLEAALAMGLMLALFGGLMGLSFASDLPRVKHPVLAGAALFTVPGLCPGLSALLGPAGLGALVLLVATCPALVSFVARMLRGRVLPSETERAGMASPEDALRLQWEESTRQLERASSIEERLLVVHAREQILDDVMARSEGELPGYVWSTTTHRGGTDLSAQGA